MLLRAHVRKIHLLWQIVYTSGSVRKSSNDSSSWSRRHCTAQSIMGLWDKDWFGRIRVITTLEIIAATVDLSIRRSWLRCDLGRICHHQHSWEQRNRHIRIWKRGCISNLALVRYNSSRKSSDSVIVKRVDTRCHRKRSWKLPVGRRAGLSLLLRTHLSAGRRFPRSVVLTRWLSAVPCQWSWHTSKSRSWQKVSLGSLKTLKISRRVIGPTVESGKWIVLRHWRECRSNNLGLVYDRDRRINIGRDNLSLMVIGNENGFRPLLGNKIVLIILDCENYTNGPILARVMQRSKKWEQHTGSLFSRLGGDSSMQFA